MQKLPPHLHLRGSTYYYRRVVPARLRQYVEQREFLISLKTSSLRSAMARANEENKSVEAILKEAEERYAMENKSTQPTRGGKAEETTPLVVTSETHARQLMRQWFIVLERKGTAWLHEVMPTISHEDLADEAMDLQISKQQIMGDDPHGERYDTVYEVERFLEHFRYSLAKGSAGYRLLEKLLPTARLEFVRRQLDRISEAPAKTYNHAFEGLHADSPDILITGGLTLGNLVEKFLEEITKSGNRLKSVAKYRTTGKRLCEIFGETRGVESLERSDVERYAEVLESVPSNITKHYPGLSFMDALKESKRRGDESRLDTNTKRDYFYNASAILKYAVHINAIGTNPFNDAFLKQRFRSKDSDEKGPPFTTQQLEAIFNAPLFTGCVDDQRGYAQPGPNVIRRGRFWVPLIALFHGARLNEICQLHTADVQEWDGGLSLNLREGDDRQLKNKPSRRLIPLHPELLKMGFVQFLASRRADTENRRLFPELPMASTGSYSDNFSKWFRRFQLHVFGERIEPSFHNFRHTFATACRVADISPQRIDRLCGWASGGRQQRAYGEAEPVEKLAEDLQRVRFEGLNLCHLYLPRPEEANATPKRRLKSRLVTF